MKLTIRLPYHTNWGENLFVTGNIAALGDGNLDAAMAMTLVDPDTWQAEVDVPDSIDAFDYGFMVRNAGGGIRREWGKPHHYSRGNGLTRAIIFDHWHEMPWDKPYFSSAFTDCINHRSTRQAPAVALPGTVTLQIAAPMVKPGQVLALVGENALLGAWEPRHAVRMSDNAFPVWEVVVNHRAVSRGEQYKFVVLDTETNEVVAWEGSDNRVFDVEPRQDESTVIAGLMFNSPEAPWRGAGTAIPVFSLRSEEDFGVGDFYDLKKMIDWAAATGQNFLQLLPINDTTMTGTWTDSYPYKANSTFALHPLYMRLSELGTLKNADRRKYFADLGAELNALPQIDYERVMNGKTEYLKEIYAQEGKKVLASADFKKYMANNAKWIRNYAAFCTLRDRFGTPDFSQWGEYAVFTPDIVNRLEKEDAAAMNLTYYIQYNLDKQMHHVRDYAHSKGVAIKGDIPIGISRTSVDAWTDTRLFYMDCQAGAPPDDFSVLGQNWGLPTYNWEEMNKDGFAWWKARFRKMSEYFDAYRIDHVLGFFRIWQIPMDALHGLLGYFNPALPYTAEEMRNNYDFWIDPGVHTRPFIMDWFLGEFFGEYTDEVRERFLEPHGGYGRYRLRPEFDTQRKVADFFAAADKNDKNDRICNGLLGLIDNVLFIEDPEQKNHYHPRISAQFSYVYRSLNDYEKSCFNRLYNDFFYHRHNDFWYGKAMWKLPPLIDATDMLCCAEDLGMIPDCVPAVINQLEILSLEIQRMPKDPKVEFGNTWTYPYLSVCTTSTHDMEGIREWWEADHEKSQRYFNNVLHCAGVAPFYCEPWVCERIVDLQLKSPSMLCIIPLQDYLSMDGDLRRKDPREERINVPANPRHYWRYRMHLTLDELNAATAFNEHLRSMIAESGR